MSKERPSGEFLELLRRSGDSDKTVAIQAQREIAKALETPLRKGVLFGDVVRGIYEAMPLEPGASPEFPLDLLAPGTEIDHIAFTNPGNGRIPEKHVESDYVMINTYGVTSSIDFLLRYAREANWNVVGRAMQVLESSFVKKMNDDGWHTLLASAVDRNILVYDGDAGAGQFTKRLVSLMKTVMRRNGGGNSVTAPGRLTDLYMSPEAIEDIRNWGIDQLDDVSRREIYVEDVADISEIDLNENRYYNPKWNVNGSWNKAQSRMALISHLAGANHKFDKSYLNTLSTDQLQKLHDDDHNKKRRTTTRRGWFR